MSPRPSTGVVTGAASGLGLATARHLAAGGMRVAGWDRDDEALRWLDGCAGVGVTVDVSDPASVARAAERTRETLGPVDFVVNSAGVLLVDTLDEARADDVRRLFDVNVLGTTLVTQALLGDLVARRGAVVNLCSTVALRPLPTNAHYAASKAAVVALTRAWALDLGPRGVRVNAVAPGPVDTGLHSRAGMDPTAVATLFEQRAAENPLQRIGTAQDVARWIERLLGDDWVTGHVLPVDGGLSLT